MIAEGATFDLSTVVNTAGLVGNASAQVDWGDGTTTNASISGGNTTGNLKVVFDYSLDTSKFFGTSASDPRRIRLQEAADSLVSRFGDTLTAVSPKQYVTVKPSIFHPSQGPSNSAVGTLYALPNNPTIAANTIIVYAGARNLPSNVRGVGGGASISFSRTCVPGPQCDQALANQNAIKSRGQAGVLAASPTDVAPLFGSISFDSASASVFYFGDDPDGISPNQIDFLSVATHELAHVLGFGTSESWNTFAASGSFTGAKAKAAYVGSGNVPLSPSHWALSVQDVQPTLMAPVISFGKRVPFSPLDFAGMDDIGWDLVNTSATVTASHRYPDDGSYPVNVILTGSRIGEVTKSLSNVNVTNVSPTLTVVSNQTVLVDQAISITNIGEFTDPGFRNNAADPATAETFTYTVNWGDGTIDDGTATIDANGNTSGALTKGSFNGSHTYSTIGNKTVTVRVVDDNGGASQKTFQVAVTAPPLLALELNRSSITENAGASAATLTIRRSGPATGSPQTITLSSSDSSEATVPTQAIIAGDKTFVTVPVTAIDDTLLDGRQVVMFNASGSGVDAASIGLSVDDYETLSATVTADQIVENEPGSVTLRLRRSNTDTANPLSITVTGVIADQLDLVGPVTIVAGTQQLNIPLKPIDDSDPELPLALNLGFSAVGYASATIEFEILDDEVPKFQNPDDSFDVTASDGITALDALRIINQLARQTTSQLDPATDDPDGVFYDVNGDYLVTAFDALLVINELARRSGTPSDSGELVLTEETASSADSALSSSSARSVDAVMQIGSSAWGFAEDDDEGDDILWRLRDGLF